MATRSKDGVIYEQTEGGWKVVGYEDAPASAGLQPVTIGQADPMKPLQIQGARADLVNDAVRLQLAQQAEARASAADARAASADDRKINLEERKLGLGDANQKVRADAITGYKSAQDLRKLITEMEALNKAGPGSTSGVMGLADYLPLTSNQRLDTAGNAARGTVGSALGFTGGQLNTAAEAAAAVGPYLPQSSDRDEVRLDKINRLKILAQTAEDRAIAQLGGVPDANGRITPVPAATAPMAPPPAGGAGSGAAAQNQPGLTPGGEGRTFYTERDKAVADEAQKAFIAGAGRPEIDAIAAKYGRQPFGPDLDAAIANRANNLGVQFAAQPTGREDTGGLSGAVAGTLPSGVGSFATGVGNAVTLGQLDNLAEMGGASEGGVDIGMRLARENAAPFFAGSLVGDTAMALGTGVGMSALAGKVANPTVAGLLSKPLTADMTFGAATGAGNADDPLYGAVGGALAGAAGNAAGGYIGSRIAGARAPQGIPNLNRGEQAVMAAVKRDDPVTVAEALQRASGLGVPANLADASPSVNSLTGAAIRRSPVVAGKARDALIPRGRGQVDRLKSAIERDLGPVGNVPQISEDLIKNARTAAGPLYDQAYTAPGASSVSLDDIINRPLSMRPGLSRARTIAAEEGRDPTSLGFDLDANGETILTRVPSFQTLDYVKRGLDDILEPHRNEITGKLALNEATRAINGTKNTLLERIDAVNPAYKAARATYAGPVSARDALARGQDAVTLSPDELALQVSNQSPEHLAQMQLGFRSQLAENGDRLRYSSNPFDSTLGTPAMEQRLATLYPENQTSVANLLAQRDMEGQMAGSSNRLIGNSMTAERQQADEAFGNNPLIEAGLHGAAAIATGGASIPGTAARLAGATVKDRLALGLGKRATEKAEQIAPISLQNDPSATIAALQALQARQQQYEVAKALLAQSGQRPGQVLGSGSVAALLASMGGQ